jgi:hypothetical protein
MPFFPGGPMGADHRFLHLGVSALIGARWFPGAASLGIDSRRGAFSALA